MTVYRGGQNICGAWIGVLWLDSLFPKPPGHIKNPSGLDFSVIYETVRGATVKELVDLWKANGQSESGTLSKN